MKSLRSRIPAKLPHSVQQKLDMYALAAMSTRTGIFEKSLSGVAALAAGAGMLVFLPSAEAKIIYTPAHVRVSSTTPLDLNHDGHVDFYLYDMSAHSTSGIGSGLWVVGVGRGYGIVGKQHAGYYASALRAGAKIGADDQFFGGHMAGRWCFSNKKTCSVFGVWANSGKGVKNRFLGLRFVVNGKTHYGWARLNVAFKPYIEATLTGYAYETVANKPIVTGQTKGPDVITLEPGSLGALATGASGRNRRK